MAFLKSQYYRNRNQISDCPRRGSGEWFDHKEPGGDFFGVDRSVLYLDCGGDYIHHTLYIHHIKMVNFTVCKLYLSIYLVLYLTYTIKLSSY